MPSGDHIRSRLSYANVMATIAVFIALGGGAYALSNHAPANSVNSQAIINGQVNSADVKDDSLTSSDLGTDSVNRDEIGYHEVVVGTIGPGAVTGVKLAPVVEVSNSIQISQGDVGDVSVSCPPFSVLLNGGANINPKNTGTSLQASFSANPNSWYARGQNPSAQYTATLEVYARCLQ